MTLWGEGNPPCPPPALRAPRRRVSAGSGSRRAVSVPGAAVPFSSQPQPGKTRRQRPGQAAGPLGVRARSCAAGEMLAHGDPPAGRAGAAGLRTEASLGAEEGLTPWLQGLPGDRELLQSPSHSEGDRYLFQPPSNKQPRKFFPRLGSAGLIASLHPLSCDCT